MFAALPFPSLLIDNIFVGKQTISFITGLVHSLMALSGVGDRGAHSCVDPQTRLCWIQVSLVRGAGRW